MLRRIKMLTKLSTIQNHFTSHHLHRVFWELTTMSPNIWLHHKWSCDTLTAEFRKWKMCDSSRNVTNIRPIASVQLYDANCLDRVTNTDTRSVPLSFRRLLWEKRNMTRDAEREDPDEWKSPSSFYLLPYQHVCAEVYKRECVACAWEWALKTDAKLCACIVRAT